MITVAKPSCSETFGKVTHEKYNPETHGEVNIVEIIQLFEEMIIIITNNDKTIEELGHGHLRIGSTILIALTQYSTSMHTGPMVNG